LSIHEGRVVSFCDLALVLQEEGCAACDLEDLGSVVLSKEAVMQGKRGVEVM
jgi:hypothetical protein